MSRVGARREWFIQVHFNSSNVTTLPEAVYGAAYIPETFYTVDAYDDQYPWGSADMRYRIVGGPNASQFQVDAVTGQLVSLYPLFFGLNVTSRVMTVVVEAYRLSYAANLTLTVVLQNRCVGGWADPTPSRRAR